MKILDLDVNRSRISTPALAMIAILAFALLITPVAVCKAADASLQQIVGRWTEVDFSTPSAEASLYVCLDESLSIIQGSYAELGYIRGTVQRIGNDVYAAGRWYNPLLTEASTKWGPFFWKLRNDSTSFEGSWAFGDDPSNVFWWNATKMSDEVPDASECWPANTQALSADINNAAADGYTVHGSWAELAGDRYRYDICIENGHVELSYSYDGENGRIQGYGSGTTYLSGQIAQIIWFDSGDSGSESIMIQSGNAIFHSYWNETSLDTFNYGNSGHGYINEVRTSKEVSRRECSRNKCTSLPEGCEDSDNDDGDDLEGVVIGLAVAVAVLGAVVVAGAVYIVLRRPHPVKGGKEQTNHQL